MFASAGNEPQLELLASGPYGTQEISHYCKENALHVFYRDLVERSQNHHYPLINTNGTVLPSNARCPSDVVARRVVYFYRRFGEKYYLSSGLKKK
jgi:hypothetical protein